MALSSDFAQEFLNLCQERNIEAHEGVLRALQRPCSSPGPHGKAALNLRTTGLDEQTCAVLGKVLSVDRLFEQIDVSDCALSDAAITNLICGLYTNSTCVKLNLKGNNIRGKAAECLGRMLNQNHTIQSLLLEWNSVGMLEDAFMSFSEGLGCNTSLVYLDLKNNQISHHGAQELSLALQRNTTLRTLDLKWNNLGLVGGRAILEAFKFNKTLDHIDLNGNDIPSDIKQAIENAARGNKEIQSMSDEYSTRTRVLTTELQNTKLHSAKQFDDLTNRLDQKEERLRKTNRVAAQKVEHFKELLDERRSAFNTMVSKLSRTESELVLAEQRVKDLEILLNKERSDREAVTSSYRHELKQSQQSSQLSENRLTVELSTITDRSHEMSGEIQNLNHQVSEQRQLIHSLKEQVATLEADTKVAAANAQERLKKEQSKHSQHIKELNQQKDKAVETARNDQAVIEQALRDHISRLDEQKRDLEDRIGKQKAQLVEERISHEEQLSQARTKLKADHDFQVRHLEDKIRLMHQAKDEMSQLMSQQTCTVSDLQTKNNSLTMQIDNLKRHIETLQQSVASKNHDVEQARHQVQLQLNEKIAELEKEQLNTQTAKEKLNSYKKKTEGQVRSLENDLDRKNEEVKHLKDKLTMREADIAWMREETAQRAQALQTAVRNYAQPLCTSLNTSS